MHIAHGSLLNYELAESSFRDKSFSSCIADSFEGLRFLPPPLGINRFLAHEFVFKTDETFMREMEERKNQAPLTLVTATPGPMDWFCKWETPQKSQRQLREEC